MATTAIDNAKSVKLYVETGVNASGNSVFSTRTLGEVNPAATNDDLLAIAEEAGTLQKFNVDAVKVSESYSLVSA